MNILLVEDETRVADFIRRGLLAEGWTVEHAPDAETAQRFLGHSRFDVVLLDLILPGMTGQELCAKIRARGNKVPILMLIALDAADERIAGLRIGADDYLPKPFDFHELVARIEALLRRAPTVPRFQRAWSSNRLHRASIRRRDRPPACAPSASGWVFERLAAGPFSRRRNRPGLAT